MACIFLGEAPRRSQQLEISLTPNLTDENINTIVTPSVSNDLLHTETISDQDNQASPPSPIQVYNPHCYMPPTLPAYSTDSQATPSYLPTSISIHLEPQSSTPSILIPIILGDIIMVTTDHQQPLIWVTIPPIPNHLSYIHIATSAPPLITSQTMKIWMSFNSS